MSFLPAQKRMRLLEFKKGISYKKRLKIPPLIRNVNRKKTKKSNMQIKMDNRTNNDPQSTKCTVEINY